MKHTPWTLCPEVIPYRPSFACKTRMAVNASDKTIERMRIVSFVDEDRWRMPIRVRVAGARDGMTNMAGVTLSKMPPGFKAPIVFHGHAIVAAGQLFPKRPGKYDWRNRP